MKESDQDIISSHGIPVNISFLILEDIQEIREMIKTELWCMGFRGEIFEAEGLRDGQTIFNENDIDFVLIDWGLKDGCGFKFLEAMRKIDEYQNTPILMITAHDDIKDVIKCMEKGASGYLIKPWMEEEFHEKVISSWSKHKSTDTN